MALWLLRAMVRGAKSGPDVRTETRNHLGGIVTMTLGEIVISVLLLLILLTDLGVLH